MGFSRREFICRAVSIWRYPSRCADVIRMLSAPYNLRDYVVLFPCKDSETVSGNSAYAGAAAIEEGSGTAGYADCGSVSATDAGAAGGDAGGGAGCQADPADGGGGGAAAGGAGWTTADGRRSGILLRGGEGALV